MPGSAPFQMKVTFHAFPGAEFLSGKEKPQIVTGDGIYEETWLSPNVWRREATLGEYHAIEEETDGVRKMQASSDYEPGRVLMLLDALLNPVPRNLASKEFRGEGASGWKIGHVTIGSTPLVSISKNIGSSKADYTDSFYFLPHGVLALRNEQGITIAWEGSVLFAGKVVSRHLTIKAIDREMLTADIEVRAAGQVDPATFSLRGARAEPGMTLRPMQHFELRFPCDISDSGSWVRPGRDSHPMLVSIRGVLDRHGRYRELELIAMANSGDEASRDNVASWLAILRGAHHCGPEIDGSPTEVIWSWIFL
jgi:hypothetical protein